MTSEDKVLKEAVLFLLTCEIKRLWDKYSEVRTQEEKKVIWKEIYQGTKLKETFEKGGE